MELKEGMYVRFEGMINSILEIDDEYVVFDYNWYDHWADEVSSMKIDRFIRDYKPVIKEDVIELIEIGDYVNGLLVIDKYYDYANKEWKLNGRDGLICNEKNIESIVTKEQFNLVKYTVAYEKMD